MLEKRSPRWIYITFYLIASLSQVILAYHGNNYIGISLEKKLHATKEVKVSNLDTKTDISIPSGSPLSLAAVRTGLRLSFQCKQGSCASCEMLLDGKRVRACITKVPEKNAVIKKAPKI